MIQEAYCSKEVSKLLKEKGFDIPVNYEYHYKITIPQFHRKKHNFNGIEYSNCSSEWYSAPTHQMAMRWLREVHDIYIVFFHTNKSGWWYNITDMKDSHVFYSSEKTMCSYEDAVEAALKYIFENLI